MRQITLRLVVALFSFCIGIFMTGVWLVSRHEQREPAPCRSCSKVYSSDTSLIPTATLSEIKRDPQLFFASSVRVHAVLENDAGQITLLDSKDSNAAQMPANLDH
ncbi:MAG: hypothetical protein M3Q76_07950, partial [Acidobacteriota bacterium]|nr:hypothetical protein [Acidobacteriota bacterium]